MSSGSKASAGYQPSGQPAADMSYQSLLGQTNPYAAALPGQTIPGLTGAASNIANNPYAGAQQTGMNQIGAQATGTVAPMEYGGAANMYAAGNAMNAPQGIAQLMQQSFDPQQNLYNQQYQQMMDQQNAINAMSGVSGPYAAGVSGQMGQTFNNDWLNQQMQRELQGITGASNLGTAASNAYTSAGTLGNMGLQTAQTGTALPYQTYLGNQQNIQSGYSNAAQGAGQALAPASQQMSDLAAYLGLGQTATQNQQNATKINNSQPGIGAALGQLLGLGTGGGSTVGGSLWNGLGSMTGGW